MVVDCITYNGELEILKLRLNILYPYVDRFIIVEAKTTFSGHKKKLYWNRDERHFQDFWKKIDYFIIDEDYTPEEIALAASSPNTKGAKHWKREFLQKESIKKALAKYEDDDTIYIGDVDEIWDVHYNPRSLEKLRLRVYAYQLNNLSNEKFWGTLVGRWSEIKDKTLNHLRSDVSLRGSEYAGWHFTSMGGLKEVRRKLNDSYTPESYNTHEVQKLLPERLRTGRDYIGRDFRFTIDERDWPLYLIENRNKYRNLIYGNITNDE